MISIKEIKIDASATIIAHIQCQNSVSLSEEDKIRKLLGKFYTKEKPDFARVAMEINGPVILFRAVHNCKRPPANEDIAKLLQAINCQKIQVTERPLHKKRSESVSHHKTQAT